MKTAAMLLAALTTPVLAAPEVVRFDPNEPFDPASDFFDLVDADPSAPDIRLSFFAHDPGGGSHAEVWHPQIVGAGWDPSGGNALLVESAIGPQGYLGAGTAVPIAAPGPWGVAHFDVFYGAPPNNYPLDLIGYEVFPFQDSCISCTYVEHLLTLDPGTYYVALRWGNDAETFYGWAAFEVQHLEYPLSCIPGIDWACDNRDLESLRRFGLRYIAAGWETEAHMTITTGGGLCRADMNLDARFDFFDIAAYLSAYVTQDPSADYTDDGSFDFFDVSAFIDEYNAGCAF